MDALKVLILGVQRYKFEDQKTEREVSGTTVHFIQLSHTNEEDKIGYFPTKSTLSYDSYEAFRGLQFPLSADAEWTLDLANKKNPIKVLGFLNLDNVLID